MRSLAPGTLLELVLSYTHTHKKVPPLRALGIRNLEFFLLFKAYYKAFQFTPAEKQTSAGDRATWPSSSPEAGNSSGRTFKAERALVTRHTDPGLQSPRQGPDRDSMDLRSCSPSRPGGPVPFLGRALQYGSFTQEYFPEHSKLSCSLSLRELLEKSVF